MTRQEDEENRYISDLHETLGLLESIEFVSSTGQHYFCPVCDVERPGPHRKGCRLREILAEYGYCIMLPEAEEL